jgi:hypothetical protein
VARGLFKALRGLDAQGVDIIFVEVQDHHHLSLSLSLSTIRLASARRSCADLLTRLSPRLAATIRASTRATRATRS